MFIAHMQTYTLSTKCRALFIFPSYVSFNMAFIPLDLQLNNKRIPSPIYLVFSESALGAACRKAEQLCV